MKENQADSYVQLSPLLVSELFNKHNVTFPRSLRVEALKKSVKKRISENVTALKKKKAEAIEPFLAKDSDRLKRLEYVDHFSEVQFENAIEYFRDPSINESYFTLLWELLVKHLIQSKNNEVLKELNQIETLDHVDHVSVLAYNRAMGDFFVDAENELDGLSFEDLRKYYEFTSTKKEVKQLADKYHVLIPSNTSKAFLRTKLLQVLKDKKKLTDELVDQINNGTIPVLKELFNDLSIDIQDLLTVSETVEMILECVRKKRSNDSTSVPVLQTPKSEEFPAESNPLLLQILANQQVILQHLQNSTTDVVEDEKKKLTDKIFNIIVISLIILVVIIWVIYAINTFF